MTAGATAHEHDAAHAATRFAEAAISRYEFPTDATLRLLSMSENATFLVERGGPIAVLRVYRQDYQSAAAVRSELAWADALRADGVVKTPAILRTRDKNLVHWVTVDGITRACTAFEYLPGEQPTPDDRRTYQLVGSIAATLHNHAERWTLRSSLCQPAQRHRWRGMGDRLR